MLTTIRQRERREGIKLSVIKIPIPPKNINEITAAFERAITPRTRLIQISHQVNLTGQITPVKAVCEMARRRGIETIVDGAHSFAQFYFKQADLNCDYFGTSLHKWLYAPKGTGMLYVKRDKIAKIWPLFACRRKKQGRHSQVRRGRHAFSRAASGDRRSDAVSPRRRRQTKRSAAALSFPLLDGSTERNSESSLQHIVRSRADVRDRERAD